MKDKSMEKPNCYACKHRATIPGDAHSSCRHPATKNEANDPFSGLVMMLAGAASGQPPAGSRELGITAMSHGILNGWFYWPYNFDPVWLLSCKGFEAKAVSPKKEATTQGA